MSGAPAAPGAPVKADPIGDMAHEIFVGAASHAFAGAGQAEFKEPDAKALASFSFKAAESFYQVKKDSAGAQAAAEEAKRSKFTAADLDFDNIGKPG